jgi:4-hydroxybenzoate polyprenyltransferase
MMQAFETKVNKFSVYWRLARMDRPAGIFLLLFPTLSALWLAAGGAPSPSLCLIFSLGSVIMRAAGGVINDYADRDIDGEVERTRNRPLAAGELQPKQALQFFGFLMLLAGILVTQLNLLCLQIALVGAVLTVLYPFSKRVTQLPQLVLSVVWSLSILMAYAAQQNTIPETAYWLFFSNACLTIAYDTIVALADKKDDVRLGVKSLAIFLGAYDKRVIGLFQVLCLVGWWQVGQLEQLGLIYEIMLGAALLFMVWCQYSIRDRSPWPCWLCFVSHQWLVGFYFVTITLSLIAQTL